MQNIQAAVIERAGVPIVIENLRLDDPGPGEILVRMTASGVCHSDLDVRDGEWKLPGPIGWATKARESSTPWRRV